MRENKKMSSLDLFTGYGGISLALKDYCTPIGYCEIERYAQAIIASRIADGSLQQASIYPDVSRLSGQINAADIIVGGFPCQDISVAGNGKGLEGERSGLFFEVIRLTKEIRPTFVFLENVPAIRTRGLEQVVKAFTEIGYDCRWTCISAGSVGAPHKRERWFLLAHTNKSELWLESRRNCGEDGESQVKLGDNGEKVPMANTMFKGLERVPKCENEVLFASERSWWEVESDVGRVVDGGSFRVDRIKCLGNGVVPLQAKTAFERLIGLI